MINYAVVGAGWISQIAFLPGVAQSGNSRVAAIVTGDRAKAAQLAEFHSVGTIVGYDGYDAVLASPAIDAVYIALPNDMHADFTIRAARAGKHVMVEKPLAANEDESLAMIAAARDANVFLMTAYRLHNEPGTVPDHALTTCSLVTSPDLKLLFVLLVKEIDLSIAAINGVTAVLMAKLIVEFGAPPWLAVCVAIVVGAAIGSLSARWVTFVGVPSFVVTLGLGLALNGIQLLLLPRTARYGLMGTGIESIAQTKLEGLSAWIAYAIGMAVFALLVLSSAVSRRRHGLHVNVAGRIALPLVGGALFGAVIVAILNAHQGIPLVVLIFALLLGVGGYILGETRFGLCLYAVGNNDEAARRAGIDVPRIKMAAFAIAGGVAALAGVIGASRTLGVGVFSGGGVGGGTLLLESIAAAVIGGVSLFGGRGSIHAALLGALVIGTVQNGLNLMGVENEVRLIVTGLLLVLAVSIDKLIEKATGQPAF